MRMCQAFINGLPGGDLSKCPKARLVETLRMCLWSFTHSLEFLRLLALELAGDPWFDI